MSNTSRYRDLPVFLRKKSTRRYRSDDMLDNYRPLIAIWVLEMALFFDWHQKPSAKTLPRIIEDGARFCSLTEIMIEAETDSEDPDEIEKSLCKISTAAIAAILRKKLVYWKKQPLTGERTLLNNLQYLGEVLTLSPADLALLSFALFIRLTPSFERIIAEQNQQVSTRQLAGLVASLTGQSESEILKSLHPDSRLLSSGLLKIERSSVDLEHKLDVMDALSGHMTTPHATSRQLASRFLQHADKPALSLDDFPHLTNDITILKPYLTEAMRIGETGVNILFYGPPGTGKTELAKALAAELGHALYEIRYSDEDGDPITGDRRLRAYNFCQRLLEGNRQAILMFDEIEDVVASSSDGLAAMFGLEVADDNKAWLNRTLERNLVPAIWITNAPDIDPAYRRRFDYSVHFPVPPLDVRKEIARRHLSEFAPNETWLNGVAANEHVTPAQYQRMAKIARIAGPSGNEAAHLLAERTLDRSMRLLGQKRMPERNVQHTRFDPSFINADENIERLVVGLKRHPHGSLCLYGPPGTGKSELARHIANEVRLPLIVKRASDLFDKYVGGTETNIANMFAEAREREGVLVLDEADSFLADRRGANRGWEVTQVNELLTQMEAFEGIFVCTTNLMANLDQASLRRFAFKIRFDYLTADQRWRMFVSESLHIGNKNDQISQLEPRVRHMDRLTPGDFSTVVRKLTVLGEVPTAAEFLGILEKECSHKEGGRGIGFMGNL